jgi:hypothetical protein
MRAARIAEVEDGLAWGTIWNVEAIMYGRINSLNHSLGLVLEARLVYKYEVFGKCWWTRELRTKLHLLASCMHKGQ